MNKIIRNSAKCAHCGHELVSTHRHDFRTHVCESAGKIARSYNHDKKAYEPACPSFSVDGGHDYLHRGFTREEDFIDTSIEETPMREEINNAARAVAGMVVEKHKPLTVPIGSLAKLPVEGKMSTIKPRAYGVPVKVIEVLGKFAQGASAAQVHFHLSKEFADWKMANTYSHLTTMKNRGELKHMGHLWYPGDTAPLRYLVDAAEERKGLGRQEGAVGKTNGHKPRGRGRVAGIRNKATVEKLLNGFDPVAAMEIIRAGLAAAERFGEYVRQKEADRELHDKQNAARLEAILKLARDV